MAGKIEIGESAEDVVIATTRVAGIPLEVEYAFEALKTTGKGKLVLRAIEVEGVQKYIVVKGKDEDK